MCTTNKDIINAIEYLRSNIQAFEIEEGWYYISNRQPIPSTLESKIFDLLEEYGADNDLPELWWEKYCDIEDFFIEL